MDTIQIYTYEQVFQIPRDILFNILYDDEKVKHWNKYFVKNIYNDGETPIKYHEGMTYQTVFQQGKKIITIRNEIKTFLEPSDVIIHADSKAGINIISWQLRAIGADTKVTINVSTLPKNRFYKLLVKLARSTVKNLYNEQFDKLYEYVHFVNDQSPEAKSQTH